MAERLKMLLMEDNPVDMDLLQEMISPIYKPLGKGTWLPGVILTSMS